MPEVKTKTNSPQSSISAPAPQRYPGRTAVCVTGLLCPRGYVLLRSCRALECEGMLMRGASWCGVSPDAGVSSEHSVRGGSLVGEGEKRVKIAC